MKKYVYDTNALLLYSHLLNLDGLKIIPHTVLRELDKLKVGLNETAFNAREAVRQIKKSDNIFFDNNFEHAVDGKNNDDIIIDCAKANEATIISGDFLVQLKAKSLGVEVYNLDTDGDEYLGYKEVSLEENAIAELYENPFLNTYETLQNEYLIVKNKSDEFVDTLYWDGKMYKTANGKGFTTTMFGKFKPLDSFQSVALDSLQRNQMTMLKGKAGSGKTLIAINYAWNQIEKGKFDKIVIFSNPVNARGSTKLGFYPGTRQEKLLNSNLGAMLASKFGDAATVEGYINQGKIELLPFADIRGWDSTGMNAIVYFSESQNLDVELMRLGISRCSDDSKVILDGDYNSQVDSDLFSGMNNGMRRVSEIYKGREFYGEVYLPNIYRSKMAEIAQLL
jgi:PhoH-like ATPase